MKKYLVKGKDVDSVLTKVSKHLKTSKENIRYEKISEEANIFGKTKQVELKVWVDSKIVKKDENKTKKSKNKDENKVGSNDNNKNNKLKSEDKMEKEKHPKNFEIDIRKDGIFIVTDENFKYDEGKKEKIKFEIIDRNIKDPSFYSLNELKSKKSVKIAEYDSEYYIDAKVKVEVINKNMKARVTVISPRNGNHITYDKILAKLQDKGVKINIKKDLIRKIVKNRYYDQEFIIAEGTPPRHGKDGRIEYLFETEDDFHAEKEEDGKVNFKELGLINNVCQNEVLAEKIDPTEGEDGIDVYGKVIKAKPGKVVEFSKGKKVNLSKDKHKLLSQIDGHVSLMDKKVIVTPLKTVSQDVDYSTGNIDFIGTVYVKGNILKGFKVKAKGDIIIDGVVEGGELEAGGNISVRHGIVDESYKEDRMVKAKGEIKTKYIENSRVVSGDNILVSQAVINSILWAQEKVIVKGTKATISGGEVIAGNEIITKRIGSKLSSRTIISVGVYPSYREDYKNIEKEISEKLNKKERFETIIENLRKKNKTGKLTKKQMKEFMRTRRELLNLETTVQMLMDRLETLDEIMNKNIFGKIHVSDYIKEGTIIKIGKKKMKINSDFEYVTFSSDDTVDKIRMFP
ncbi:MAG: DUF342 domain-containing protein, partial [Fusobacteriota bacterium]